MAVVSYVPSGLFALGWFFEATQHWAWQVLGWVGIGCAILTVYCTGMIYASLKTIRQWHMPGVAPLYVLLAAATGAVLFNLLVALFGYAADWSSWTAVGLLSVALVLKLAYWFFADRASKDHTVGRATGLGRFGQVTAVEAPHSTPNFVMREMGYSVARKHSRILRLLAVLFGFALPIAATAIMLLPSPLAASSWAILAVLFGAIGILIERWLFFAEAQHIVTLFYGAREA